MISAMRITVNNGADALYTPFIQIKKGRNTLGEYIPTAYKGDEPYLFISYAHKDSDTVLPVIARLQKEGYRIWYDEGIAPGSSWDVYISEHLDKSCNVLAFLSKAFLKSQNCRDELALTRSKGISMNIIYIDDAELSPGLRMRYGRIQALFMNRMPEDEFIEKLCKTEAMAAAKEQVTV